MVREFDSSLERDPDSRRIDTEFLVKAVCATSGKTKTQVLSQESAPKDTLSMNFIDPSKGEDAVMEQIDNMAENVLDQAIDLVVGGREISKDRLNSKLAHASYVIGNMFCPYNVPSNDKTRYTKRRFTAKSLDVAARGVLLRQAVDRKEHITFLKQGTVNKFQSPEDEEHFNEVIIRHGSHFTTGAHRDGVKLTMRDKLQNFLGSAMYQVDKDSGTIEMVYCPSVCRTVSAVGDTIQFSSPY